MVECPPSQQHKKRTRGRLPPPLRALVVIMLPHQWLARLLLLHYSSGGGEALRPLAFRGRDWELGGRKRKRKRSTLRGDSGSSAIEVLIIHRLLQRTQGSLLDRRSSLNRRQQAPRYCGFSIYLLGSLATATAQMRQRQQMLLTSPWTKKDLLTAHLLQYTVAHHCMC